MEEGREAQSKGDDLYQRLFGEARNYEDSSKSSNFRIPLFSEPYYSTTPINDYENVLTVVIGFGIAT